MQEVENIIQETNSLMNFLKNDLNINAYMYFTIPSLTFESLDMSDFTKAFDFENRLETLIKYLDSNNSELRIQTYGQLNPMIFNTILDHTKAMRIKIVKCIDDLEEDIRSYTYDFGEVEKYNIDYDYYAEQLYKNLEELLYSIIDLLNLVIIQREINEEEIKIYSHYYVGCLPSVKPTLAEEIYNILEENLQKLYETDFNDYKILCNLILEGVSSSANIIPYIPFYAVTSTNTKVLNLIKEFVDDDYLDKILTLTPAVEINYGISAGQDIKGNEISMQRISGIFGKDRILEGLIRNIRYYLEQEDKTPLVKLYLRLFTLLGVSTITDITGLQNEIMDIIIEGLHPEVFKTSDTLYCYTHPYTSTKSEKELAVKPYGIDLNIENSVNAASYIGELLLGKTVDTDLFHDAVNAYTLGTEPTYENFPVEYCYYYLINQVPRYPMEDFINYCKDYKIKRYWMEFNLGLIQPTWEEDDIYLT